MPKLRLTLLLLCAVACSDPLVPAPGAHYVLRSLNGRPVPTTMTSLQPVDSQFDAYAESQLHILSDSSLTFGLWITTVTLHSDGTRTETPLGCWKDFPYDYRRHADTLFLTEAYPFANRPPVNAYMLIKGEQLVDERVALDGPVTLRYARGDSITTPCGLAAPAIRAP
jgi:hypothetical protein